MQRVIPALRVQSYQAALEFYERLGFQEQWTHVHADGLPVFASIALDGMEINLTEHAGDCQPGGLVHFYVDDVDALFAEFRARGAQVERAPKNNLGPDIRDMLVVDPDGNRLSFLTVQGGDSQVNP